MKTCINSVAEIIMGSNIPKVNEYIGSLTKVGKYLVLTSI